MGRGTPGKGPNSRRIGRCQRTITVGRPTSILSGSILHQSRTDGDAESPAQSAQLIYTTAQQRRNGTQPANNEAEDNKHERAPKSTMVVEGSDLD